MIKVHVLEMTQTKVSGGQSVGQPSIYTVLVSPAVKN